MNKLTQKTKPIWPPTLNTYISIRNFNNSILYGKVFKIINNNTAIIRLLKKSHQKHNYTTNTNIDPLLAKHLPNNSNPSDYLLLYQNDNWNYVYILLNSEARPKPSSYELSKSNTHYYDSKTDSNEKLPLNKLVNSDMDDFSFLTDSNINYDNKDNILENIIINPDDLDLENLDGLKKYIDWYIEFDNEKRISMLNKLDGKTSTESKSDISNTLTENWGDKLNKYMTKPLEILITDQDMINKYVPNEKTIMMEYYKLKKFLNEVFFLDNPDNENSNIFVGLRFTYHDGYLHVFRTEIPIYDVITHRIMNDTEEEPKLKKLGDTTYGKKINHNILKHVIIQNKQQLTLNIDREMMTEAEMILSQEYIIALTPEPRYQLWCFVRLIKLWYADIDLQYNIKKVKLLINQFRADSKKQFNIKNGIRFSIGIYPRYGKDSATRVLKKINYYFGLYVQSVGWRNIRPSYFKIVNDLISYTNSNQSLKIYYKSITEQNKNDNTVFIDNYTRVNSPGHDTDILSQYVKL